MKLHYKQNVKSTTVHKLWMRLAQWHSFWIGNIVCHNAECDERCFCQLIHCIREAVKCRTGHFFPVRMFVHSLRCECIGVDAWFFIITNICVLGWNVWQISTFISGHSTRNDRWFWIESRISMQIAHPYNYGMNVNFKIQSHKKFVRHHAMKLSSDIYIGVASFQFHERTQCILIALLSIFMFM